MSARCRVQQATCGHRDRKGEPLYAARRTLHTGCVRNGDTRRFRTTGRLCYGSDWYSRQRGDHNVVMDPIDPDSGAGLHQRRGRRFVDDPGLPHRRRESLHAALPQNPSLRSGSPALRPGRDGPRPFRPGQHLCRLGSPDPPPGPARDRGRHTPAQRRCRPHVAPRCSGLRLGCRPSPRLHSGGLPSATHGNPPISCTGTAGTPWHRQNCPAIVNAARS